MATVYKIKIEQVVHDLLVTTVEVEAENESEAMELARIEYESGDYYPKIICLDSDAPEFIVEETQ
jgi:hypothetical protein